MRLFILFIFQNANQYCIIFPNTIKQLFIRFECFGQPGYGQIRGRQQQDLHRPKNTQPALAGTAVSAGDIGQIGQQLEVEIEGIGVLRNPVIVE